MSHCNDRINCLVRDCICGCAGCNPLKPGQLTTSGFRAMLAQMVRDDRMSTGAHMDIIAALDIGIANDPTPPEYLEMYRQVWREREARRASGACMAESGDDWCCLPDMHLGEHRVASASR